MFVGVTQRIVRYIVLTDCSLASLDIRDLNDLPIISGTKSSGLAVAVVHLR